MAMSESHLIWLHQRQWGLEQLVDDVRAAALGRHVRLWWLISERGRYSEKAAARFAAIMARKCVAARRARGSLEEVMEMGEDYDISLAPDMFSDEDIEGPFWHGGDGEPDGVDGEDDGGVASSGACVGRQARGERTGEGAADGGASDGVQTRGAGVKESGANAKESGAREANAAEEAGGDAHDGGGAHDDGGMMKMLADLFYCAIRISASNPNPYWDEDSARQMFFAFAYMPLKPKRYVQTEDNSYAYVPGPDEDEVRVPDVEPMAGEREDLAEQWLAQALESRSVAMDDFNTWDDMPMCLAHYYALLSGCDLTPHVPDPSVDSPAAPHGPLDDPDREINEGILRDIDPESYDRDRQWDCDQYMGWRDRFANPEEFRRRYERFRAAWWRLGLPDGLDVDMRRAFDLTLVELDVSPLEDDGRYGKVMTLLQEVKDQLDAMVADRAFRGGASAHAAVGRGPRGAAGASADGSQEGGR